MAGSLTSWQLCISRRPGRLFETRCLQCCCPRGKSLSSRTNFQVLVFVLVLGHQVLVLVLEAWLLVLVLVLESQVLDNNTGVYTAVISRLWLSAQRGMAATSASTPSVSAAPTLTCCLDLRTLRRPLGQHTSPVPCRDWWRVQEEPRPASRRLLLRFHDIRPTSTCSTCYRVVSATCHPSAIRTAVLSLSTPLIVGKRSRYRRLNAIAVLNKVNLRRVELLTTCHLDTSEHPSP